jgi:hypothetical protein
MMSEYLLRRLRARRDGFIHLAPSHTVTIADVHTALLWRQRLFRRLTLRRKENLASRKGFCKSFSTHAQMAAYYPQLCVDK